MSHFSKFFAFSLLLLIFSCEKEAILPDDSPKLQGSPTTVTYGVTPSLNTYSQAGSNVNLSGSCGTFTGNQIRSKVIAQNGGQFLIQISNVNGLPFLFSGTAYVKAGSVCGPIAGSALYSGGDFSVNILINAGFSQGISHYYPVFLNFTGTRYYSEPILVYTIPSYSTGSYFGRNQGTVDGAPVYYNANTSPTTYNYYNGINTGYKWQCVEFINRYYLQVYGMDIRGTTGGNAYQYYSLASQKGLLAYVNEGPTPPRVGDILCFSGGTGNGHVSIITEVGSNQIKVAHQNVGSLVPIGCSFSRTNGNKITPWSGYTCQGWLRKP